MSGERYRDGHGRPVELGELLGAGGEGSVFAVRGSEELCAKIYRPDRAAARADKILAMLAHRPGWLVRRAVAWPVAPLYTGAGGAAFAGFLMPARRGMIELYRLVVPDERMAVAGFLTQRDLFLVAARLAGIVAGIHRAGHVVGDLKPQNVLVDPVSGKVALIDADSLQIRDGRAGAVHRSLVVTPEYAAPELCGADLARVDRAPASDGFALAVLIHQILLGGAHPFDGDLAPGAPRSAERVPGRIRRGLCPFVPGVTAVRPAAGALPFASLPEPIQALFVRAFGAGHARPDERPGAAEWRTALIRAGRDLVRCPASSAHRHGARLRRCPFCERRERSGIDPFPAGQSWQRAIARDSTSPAATPEAERLRRLRRHVRGRLAGGKVTHAERAWLEKTGAALGFDRARVGKTIEEEATRTEGLRLRARLAELGQRLSARRRPAIVAASLAAGAAVALAGAAAGRSLGAPSALPASRSAACAAAERHVAIGNTQGRGVFLRAAPSTASEKLPLPDGTPVILTGRTQEADERTWSEIEVPHLARSGWVATRYLVDPADRPR